ncbi:MAG TPA: hypothetical protein VHJ18_12875 [Streptosporangiaceae bacterium]|jgi:hypothetical protein|nr:hypothetical protein [Streptosporangiaceae bacterium]
MAGKVARQTGMSVLGIYLNDHLAGATGGSELARRIAASRHVTAAAGVLEELADEIAHDRAALLNMMAALGIPVRGYKVCAAWLGEKAARLKPNGHLRTRSPLSSLEELEMLRLGVEGKGHGMAYSSGSSRKGLAARCRPARGAHVQGSRQADLLEELRVQAADQIIGSGTTGRTSALTG